MTAMNPSAGTGRTVAVQDAAQRLYRAEVALHDAHSTHVDPWITAAADRLHEAIETYLAAVAATP
jgi:hypothetical protein